MADIIYTALADATTDSDTTTTGITYDSKKKVLTLANPFNGSISAAGTYASAATIDASKVTNPVMLIGGENAIALYAGTGNSTLVGGKKADKLFGNSGSDTFVYTVGQDADVLNSVAAQDVVSISGATRAGTTFTDKNSSVVLSFTGDSKKLTINKTQPDGTVKFKFGTEEFTYGYLPEGASFDDKSKKTAITISNSATSSIAINAAEVASTAKTIEGSKTTVAVSLVGNANANVISAGSGGSTLYGGHSAKAVADKLIGGSGKDVFVYYEGDGKDVISGFNGADTDTVLLPGIAQSAFDSSTVTVSTKNIVVKFKDGGTLTLDDPSGRVNFVNDSDQTLFGTGIDFKTGIGYNAKKTAVTVIGSAAANASVDLSNPDYFSTIKDIDASAYTNAGGVFIGNSGANVIRAGSAGATMDGGDGKDQLIGGAGKDTFKYTLKQGADTFTSVESQDTIELSGTTRASMTFSDKGNAVNVSFREDKNSKLTINKTSASGYLQFKIGTEEFTYGYLPEGAGFDAKKTAITLGSGITGSVAINAAEVLSTAKTLNASATTVAVSLTGNDNADAIYAGSGGSTLYGGEGNDKLYGGDGKDVFVYADGDGKDVIYNFDGNGTAGDFVLLKGVTKLADSDITTKGNKVTVKLPNGTLTLDDPQGKVIFMAESDSTLTELNRTGVDLPEGVAYNQKRNALVVGSDSTVASTSIDLSTGFYASTAKDLIATGYKNAASLVGDANANAIYAGNGNSTLDGKGGNDKLFGGTGVDYFMYTIGDGADVLNSVEAQDIISISGTTLANLSLSDKGSAVNVSFTGDTTKSKLTINKQTPNGSLHFKVGSEDYTYGSLPSFASFDDVAKKTAIKIDKEATGTIAINAKNVASTAKTLDASAATSAAVSLIGNANANEIKAGGGGSTLYGGSSAKAANDKLYGGGGKDVFVYYDGDGKDVISGFNGADTDTVLLPGIAQSAFDSSTVTVSTKNIVVKFKSGTLTLDDPQGEVKFVNDSDQTLFQTGINFPSGVGYNAKKTAITVDGSASNVDPIDLLNNTGYFNTVKEIDASAYKEGIYLIGNGNKNVLRAGEGTATLDGGYNAATKKSTADQLYGSTVGANVFVWDVSLGGADQIYNYDYARGDIISVTGGTITRADFAESGKTDVVLTKNGNKLTIVNGKNHTIVANDGTNTIDFGSLPGGVSYADDKRTVLSIADPFSGTVNVEDYSAANSIITLDASKNTKEVTLIGSKKAKNLIGGAGKSTLVGNASADNVTCGSGSDTFVFSTVEGGGKDIIYSFDSDADVIKLVDASVKLTDFTEKNGDVTLTVSSKGSITLKEVPRKATIKVVDKDGNTISYKTLPTGVSYDAKKTTVKLDKTFVDASLIVSDLGGLEVSEINASAATKAVDIQAGSTATKITAGKGGSTMTGGAGNDTLVGSSGADTFKTSGGNDIFDKYTTGADKIEIASGTVSSSKVNNKDVVLTLSTNNTVTVKSVVGKAMTIIQNGVSSTFTVNKDGSDPFAPTPPESTPEASAQLATRADDYWFIQSNEECDEIGALIGESATANDAAIASMSTDFDAAKALMNSLAPNVADKKKK